MGAVFMGKLKAVEMEAKHSLLQFWQPLKGLYLHPILHGKLNKMFILRVRQSGKMKVGPKKLLREALKILQLQSTCFFKKLN